MTVFSSIRPTVRRRAGRWVTYILAVVIVLVIVFKADWPSLANQFLNGDVALQMWPSVITTAFVNTLFYTIASFIFGTILAVVFALLKMAGGPFGWFATAYIELFRGIPALLTLFAVGYMVPIAFGVTVPGGARGAGILGLTLITSAYMAEVLRAGIQAVPAGQREAARSLGMTNMQTMTWVVLPQGFRIVIPPITNELVMLLKDSSLLYILGFAINEKELTTFARDGLTTYANATPLIVSAVLYLVITLPLTWLVGKLEKKLDPKR